jgi:hypothetical protein
MSDVRDVRFDCNAEQVVGFWIDELYLKRREVRRHGKAKFRVAVILNNAIIKDGILLKVLRANRLKTALLNTNMTTLDNKQTTNSMV